MRREEFEELVEEGIGAIPERFLHKLDNVAICIEDGPTADQLRKMKIRSSSLLLGLYEGVPQTKRRNYAQVLPDKITIFQKSIEHMARSKEDARHIVTTTVWHEIAHHFGMEEREVRIAERRRGQKE